MSTSPLDPIQLEERVRRLEEYLRLANEAAGLQPWDFVFIDRSVANCRKAPDDELCSEADDPSAWPTLAAWLAQDGVDVHYQAECIQTIQACADGETPKFALAYPITLPNRSVRWRRLCGIISRHANGAPSTLRAISLDISSEKRSEEERDRLKETVELVLRGTQQATAETHRFLGLMKQTGVYTKAQPTSINMWEPLGHEPRQGLDDFGKQAEDENQWVKTTFELATKLSGVMVWRYDFIDGQLDNARETLFNVWETLGYESPPP